MERFREDLLDVFFVCKDGTFALEVSTPDNGEAFVIRAFERPAGGREDGQRIERATAQCIQTSHASFSAPSAPDSAHAPSRLGSLTLVTESNYDDSVVVMFGGPPPPDATPEFAWHAIRPDVSVDAVAAFPFYRGSFMASMTDEDWGESYDSPAYWYSPQRVYRPTR